MPRRFARKLPPLRPRAAGPRTLANICANSHQCTHLSMRAVACVSGSCTVGHALSVCSYASQRQTHNEAALSSTCAVNTGSCDPTCGSRDVIQQAPPVPQKRHQRGKRQRSCTRRPRRAEQRAYSNGQDICAYARAGVRACMHECLWACWCYCAFARAHVHVCVHVFGRANERAGVRKCVRVYVRAFSCP